MKKERVRVVPGELRQRDVQVGTHLAVSPGALPRFLERFDQVYTRTGKAESILSSAAAHHRLLWMHPFLDGNGRVARLMSHAVMLDLLDSGGVWSVARGLARNAQEYKALLSSCDMTRRNDLDGRCERASCYGRREEIRLGELPARSDAVLDSVLYRGELARGEVETIVGTGDRQARRIVSALTNAGVLVSEGVRAPLRLAFPATLASRWMPGLFPEKTS